MRLLPAVVLAAAGGVADAAEGLPPGLWKLTLESRGAVGSDSPGVSEEREECLSETDLERPEQLLLGYGLLRLYVCETRNREEIHGRVAFELKCSDSLGIGGRGELTYTAKNLDGTLDASFAAAPKSALKNRLRAVYLGHCPEPEP